MRHGQTQHHYIYLLSSSLSGMGKGELCAGCPAGNITASLTPPGEGRRFYFERAKRPLPMCKGRFFCWGGFPHVGL
jgi:hypothetical protein